MTLQEVLEPLRRWSEAGERAGVATLLSVRRSAPRPPGARFAVSEGGQLAGSVSAGCVEGDLHEHIRDVLKEGDPRVVHYGITDEMAAEVGLACGGEIEVHVGEHDPGLSVWARLEEALEAGEAVALVTDITRGARGGTAGPDGARDAGRGRAPAVLLVRPDGSRVGTLGDPALDDEAVRRARGLLDTGGTEVVELDDPEATLFVEACLPPPRVAVVGASPVARALCDLASRAGWEVVLVDPREAFAREEAFPAADRILVAWPEEGLEEAGLDRYLDVVVLAHDRKIDVPALAAALRAGCRYVGQLGGSRTQRLRREELEEMGFAPEDLERIRGPVGLDIGAETAEEIAVSILAEMVAVRRGALR